MLDENYHCPQHTLQGWCAPASRDEDLDDTGIEELVLAEARRRWPRRTLSVERFKHGLPESVTPLFAGEYRLFAIHEWLRVVHNETDFETEIARSRIPESVRFRPPVGGSWYRFTALILVRPRISSEGQG